MATIEDASAALAGVSVATVSRVMNNSYVVSEENGKSGFCRRPRRWIIGCRVGGRGQKKERTQNHIGYLPSVVIYEDSRYSRPWPRSLAMRF